MPSTICESIQILYMPTFQFISNYPLKSNKCPCQGGCALKDKDFGKKQTLSVTKAGYAKVAIIIVWFNVANFAVISVTVKVIV